MKNKTKVYWQELEQIALKEGDLVFAIYCQKKKHAAGVFVVNKIK